MTADPANDPFAQFQAWLDEAAESEPNDPTAMTVATVGPSGTPSARIVLMRGFDSRGIVFYTNTESRKGQELDAHPHTALVFHWKSLRRQVRIEGPVARVSDAEADAYFRSRARGSQIGAWASDQSRVMEGRWDLEKRVARMAARYAIGEVPRPPHWTGYRVTPESFEFWSDKPFRLHERVLFTRDGDGWTRSLLYP